MKTIKATIERSKDGSYGVFCIDQPYTGMGNTSEAAKANMLEAMDIHKQVCLEEGFDYPEFLNEEFEVVYKFNTQSLLEYYAGIITPAALERISGIQNHLLIKQFPPFRNFATSHCAILERQKLRIPSLFER